MLVRAMTEITDEAIETTLDLMDRGSLYRGDEFKGAIQKFQSFRVLNENTSSNLLWGLAGDTSISRIRNTVIGTLLVDLSEGRDLEAAVSSYEQKVAPQNYKRSSALITQGMIDKASEKIKELGIEDSLYRRFAKAEDVSINDVLFADRSTPLRGNSLLDDLKPTKPVEIKGNPREIGIEDFIKNVLPQSVSMEVMLENRHQNNMVSLIAPQYDDAPNILKWDNNFTFSYNGNVTDAIKENVKSAGGNVDGVMRFSIQWNDENDSNDDLDAHCIEPSGNRIFFSSKISRKTGGQLDVDIIEPGNKVAVENIFYQNRNKLEEGVYTFLVNNYTHRGGSNFSAQIEIDGEISDYRYNR